MYDQEFLSSSGWPVLHLLQGWALAPELGGFYLLPDNWLQMLVLPQERLIDPDTSISFNLFFGVSPHVIYLNFLFRIPYP